MENLRDTPARYEENELYQRDPLSNHAKPFSSKQMKANEQHKRLVTLYHKEHGRQKFDRDEMQSKMAEGWRDVPFVHPRHPDKKIDAQKEQESPPLIDALRDEAVKMGVTVDKRWGEKKLKEEILKAADNSE